tara:strand:+ start:2442 stop:3095 length:654 start_codon:yes stop_codon:yes gene_type:complete
MKYCKAVALAGFIAVLLVSSVQAAIITTYTDKAAFLADTGAASVSGTLPNLGGLGVGNPVILGGVTLNLAGNSTQFFVDNRTPVNPGFDIAISGDENFDAVLDVPTYSFGFDVVEPDAVCFPGVGCFNQSQFTVTVGSDSEIFTLMGLSSDLSTPILDFVGIVSDTPFSFVEVRETITSGSTNEYFGEFYAAPVPIPASIWLFGSAIGLLGWIKRKV